ncbi:uncharacterized protein PG998_003014 [Apiospora kogelbergensis]|uniref:Uncharacterized protein n=1 Tax=Apiospora kogelbergensis TaxID=1337665 RepID=A0AAW0QLC8_9PEZI
MRAVPAQLGDQESQELLDNHVEIAESITNSEIEATTAALLGRPEPRYSPGSADTAIPTCSTDAADSRNNPFGTQLLNGDDTAVSGDSFWGGAERYVYPALRVTKRPKHFKEERSSLALKVFRMLEELTE